MRYKSLNIITNATIRLSLFMIYKIPLKNAIKSFWTLPVPYSFNRHFILFCNVNVFNLNLLLETYSERTCTKYLLKPQNFLIVYSQILQMKNEMSRFTSVPHFARSYPMTLQCSKVALLKNEREISVFVFHSSENELNTINKN